MKNNSYLLAKSLLSLQNNNNIKFITTSFHNSLVFNFKNKLISRSLIKGSTQKKNKKGKFFFMFVIQVPKKAREEEDTLPERLRKKYLLISHTHQSKTSRILFVFLLDCDLHIEVGIGISGGGGEDNFSNLGHVLITRFPEPRLRFSSDREERGLWAQDCFESMLIWLVA